ncbi:hypothetical protein [Winogradskyella sp.]|jgi:hypothetical protein|uniref:hypothetical protein n=1 Tax=Winogradskyella sp. TaxID=1883156 RepID=UPI0025D87C70|nr:hypothetical protein [Winogradskyella sp.]MCT4629778.1 hypothetical protein [Winogradskyella sp.]
MKKYIMRILISNESYYDKEHINTFRYQKDYKYFTTSSDIPGIFDPSLETLIEALGEEIVQETFKDKPLIQTQTQSILVAYSNLLDRLKKERGPIGPPKSKSDILKNRDLGYYETLIEICNECLEENKPMYLSIE